MRKSQFARRGALILSALLLSACELLPFKESSPAPTPSATPTAESAPAVTPAPMACPVCQPCAKCPGVEEPPAAKPLQLATWADVPGWANDDLKAGWPAFLQSCRALTGKPNNTAWKRVCQIAQNVDPNSNDAQRAFYEKEFQPHTVVAANGNPEGLITGYYEPLLKGSRNKGKPYLHPLLGVPEDMITVDLASIYPELKNLRLRGRLQGNKLVPYWTRGEIEARGVPAKPLLYVDDAVESFFLQVQGSGRIRLPNGELVRVGYADQNGHPYQSIGRVLVERGYLKLEEASMQGIQAWARSNPGKLQEVLNANPSYVFFRELPASNDGPLGSLGVPLTAERSLAIDPRTIPLGAPVYLSTTRPNSQQPLRRLMHAQDTGGAIKGAVRADYFWGFGAQAGEQAGRMKQSGRLWVLLPIDLPPK